MAAIFPNSSNKSLNPGQLNIYNELAKNERHGQYSRSLDFSITESEIRKAAIELKKKKSPFSDKIRNEMVKATTLVKTLGTLTQ